MLIKLESVLLSLYCRNKGAEEAEIEAVNAQQIRFQNCSEVQILLVFHH